MEIDQYVIDSIIEASLGFFHLVADQWVGILLGGIVFGALVYESRVIWRSGS